MPDSYPNLLLVEDDQSMLLVIREMLESEFRLRAATTLREGIDALEGGRPDAILLDLSLPDCSGFDTFSRMFLAAEGVPIIIFSGIADEKLAVHAVQHGAQDYLIKGSVDSRLLTKALRYAIERARIQSDLRETQALLEQKVIDRTQELSDTNQRLTEALDQLKRTQESAVRRERLHAMGNVASLVAHDFNDCLSPIIGYVDLLLDHPERLANTAEVEGYLVSMRESAHSAEAISHQLNSFYCEQSEKEHFKSFDLNRLVTETLNLNKSEWIDLGGARGVAFELRANLLDLPPVHGVPRDLRIVIKNLVTNAVESLTHDGEISIRTLLRNGNAVLEVEDSGGGMSNHTRKHCFDPFFTTKGEAASGFGLATVYGIAKRHGGGVAVESIDGEGTILRVNLPIQDRKKKIVVEKLRSVSDTTEELIVPLNILVADDEPLLRKVIESCLAADGHSVHVAADGAEAVKAFCEGTFDLVITDWAMPEMNGQQVALAIKEVDPAMYIILLTGFADLMVVASGNPPGINDVVGKPFTVDGLRKAIAKCPAAQEGQ